MARREIGTRWDRENRNNINENFKELYDVQDRAIEEATQAIVDSAKLVWLEPVNTFADIATTYPNPETGHTVFVRDTGKVYRFYNGSWMEIQQIDAGPVNEIDTRLSAEIEENRQEIEQARTKADGTTFPVLRDRLNDVDDKIGILNEQLAQIGIQVGERLATETDDVGRINRAIEEAKNSGVRVVRLEPNKVYDVSSQINLPNDIPISIVCEGLATIRATSVMETILYKPLGYVEQPKFEGIILDGQTMANYCFKIEQALRPSFVNCHFKNARIAPLATGRADGTGSLFYEASFQNFKITGIDSGKYPSSDLPSYGIHVMPGSTDNHFDDIVVRNAKLAGIRDEGSNNRYGIVHIFGYPEPDYIPDYGLDIVNGRVFVNALYTDGVRIAGIKMRQGFNIVTGCNFYWRFDTEWDKSGACGIEIDSTANNYIIIGNYTRGSVGTDIRYLGDKSGIVFGNYSVSVTNPTPYHIYNYETTFGKKLTASEGIEVLTKGLTVKGLTKIIQENANNAEFVLQLLGTDNSKYIGLLLGADGSPRWKLQKSGNPETGSNTGSDFNIVAYQDNLSQTTALTIRRNSRDIIAYGNLRFNNLYNGPIIKSPDGSEWRIEVDNTGELRTVKL